MVFKNSLILMLLAFLTSSCAIWPYESDFDCPVQEGLKCKSLYEISKMAEEGRFGPSAKIANDNSNNQKQFENRCSCCRSKNKLDLAKYNIESVDNKCRIRRYRAN